MDYIINLVEDDENLNKLLSSYLENEGWSVNAFLTGEGARKVINKLPHLWILDIMLPDIDGYQLIKEIKNESSEVPVIFISARDADLDRITGLEKGSDDYLAKPFSPRELVIRVHKLLDRIYGEFENKDKLIQYNEYRVDLNKRVVYYFDTEVRDMTSLEFDLLVYLLRNKHQALSREQILDNIWGAGYYGRDRVVDDTIRRIRKKLPLLKLETLYGYGYRLVDTDVSTKR